ncbi:hypothetical protein TIFTF001_016814 [Ficus carica]|uniref:Uncharacterized protein n=1 Tax=Ficus carica TaxID=3494 RepID=A0AA88A6Y4_FICCA|nr:hypothetical protein TIFTF001_016814 [Ficus carica]
MAAAGMGYGYVVVIADGVTWGGLLPDRRRDLRSHLAGKMGRRGWQLWGGGMLDTNCPTWIDYMINSGFISPWVPSPCKPVWQG